MLLWTTSSLSLMNIINFRHYFLLCSTITSFLPGLPFFLEQSLLFTSVISYTRSLFSFYGYHSPLSMTSMYSCCFCCCCCCCCCVAVAVAFAVAVAVAVADIFHGQPLSLRWASFSDISSAGRGNPKSIEWFGEAKVFPPSYDFALAQPFPPPPP